MPSKEDPFNPYHFPVSGYNGHRPSWSRDLPGKLVKQDLEARPTTGRSKSGSASRASRSCPPSSRASTGASSREVRLAQLDNHGYRPSVHGMPGYNGHQPLFWDPTRD
mmetsp:Transcript_111468/g.314749  ORF Transcript_111468/g.314749 Transcript_111468/m.314749 type:complete len:108 (-) Transcript_111468:143-466(-)